MPFSSIFFFISCKFLVYLNHLHSVSKMQCGRCTYYCLHPLKSCLKTFVLLTDKTEDEAITITFGCIMPTTLALLFISVACYCVHKYIHVHKQKHPTNLVSVICCRRSLSELCVFQGSKQAWRKLWLAPNKSSRCH